MHSLHEHGSIFGFLRGVGLSECTNIRKGEQHIIDGSKWVGRQADRPKEEVRKETIPSLLYRPLPQRLQVTS